MRFEQLPLLITAGLLGFSFTVFFANSTHQGAFRRIQHQEVKATATSG